MPEAAVELTRKTRKQLATFRGELSRHKIHTREQLQAYLRRLSPREQDRIAGLVPYVFPATNRAAN